LKGIQQDAGQMGIFRQAPYLERMPSIPSKPETTLLSLFQVLIHESEGYVNNAG